MRVNRVLIGSALALGIVTGSAAAQAADITWGTATTIANDSDVSTTGTLVAAYNVGDANVAPVSINGVPFAAFPITEGANTTTHGSLTIQGFQGTEPINSSTAFGSGSAPFSGLSASYRTLLSTGVVKNGGNPILDLTFSVLNVGDSYSVQLWFNNSTPNFNSVTVSDFNGHFKIVDINSTDVAGGVGQFILGSFVADSASEFMSVGGFPPPPILNGIQLRDSTVPEPSTFVLAVLAFGTMWWRFRFNVGRSLRRLVPVAVPSTRWFSTLSRIDRF
jgi:hypothetical protein